MRHLSFADLAFTIISKYISSDEIPSLDLKKIVRKSFSTFRHEGITQRLFVDVFLHTHVADVTPTLKLSNFWVLELFHGPTFAFKDVALQFLGNLFEYFLTRGKYQNSITILGATSGDTGSAAIHGLRGKKNVNCFIMYPDGKVTDIQERQMTTIPDPNVHCINIKVNALIGSQIAC
jgi:threonine synthase